MSNGFCLTREYQINTKTLIEERRLLKMVLLFFKPADDVLLESRRLDSDNLQIR